MNDLQVGDRVVRRGWPPQSEPDRHGVVAECYTGIRSNTSATIPMIAVKWDGSDEIDRGYIVAAGGLEREAQT